MATLYIDTSALGRVLLRESDREAILKHLTAFEQHVASRVMRVELRRLGLRNGLVNEADRLPAGIALIPVDESLLSAAESVPPPTVATLDAIHLATALRLSDAGRLDAIMTYDARLAAGAREHGIAVLAPS